MADVLFDNDAGVASRFTVRGGAVPGSLTIQGTDTFTRGNVLITGVRGDSKVHQQTQPSLGQGVYILTFGDKPTRISINGLCVNAGCNQGTSRPGLVDLIRYYEANKASATFSDGTLPLITVSIGAESFEGMLVAAQWDAGDPKNRIGRFSLTLQTFPRPLIQ